MSAKAFTIFLLLLLHIGYSVTAQTHYDPEDGFTKYDNHKHSSYLVGKHQLLFSVNFTIDYRVIDKSQNDVYGPVAAGNLAPGFNSGIGTGYFYRINFIDMPQSVGIGVKGEWYPLKFYKFNLLTETDLILVGNKNYNAVAFSGGEFNLTFNKDFTGKEAHWIFYFGEINIKNYEIKWGLQWWWERILPILYLDESWNVLKITYQLDIKNEK